MKVFVLGGLLLAVHTVSAAASPDLAKIAAAYGARPTVIDMEISPSGDKLLYYTPTGTHGLAVIVADTVAGTTKIILSSPRADAVPYGCNWKSEARVICRIFYNTQAQATHLSFNRAISIAADGSSRVMLGQRESDDRVELDQQGAFVIDWLPDDPDHVLMQVNMAERSSIGSNIGNKGGGISVQKVDVNTGQMQIVERAKPLVMDYRSDNQGQIRFMAVGDVAVTGYQRDRASYLLRGKDSKEWRRVAEGNLSGRSPWVFRGFDDDGDNIFVLRDKDGHKALFRDPVDGGAGSLVFADPGVDVDGVHRIGKFRRPVAAIYTTEGTQYAFFDQALDRRSKALSAALPGAPPVWIIDENWDGKRNLLYVGGIDDPGHYFRYDVPERKLSPLLDVRPELVGYATGKQSAVRYAAADGNQVPGFLTVPAGPAAPRRPAIILPHGGPGQRDSLGFDWLAQFYVQLGYVVLQPNFRGSTGYGAEWYAQNGFKSWEAAMADINAGARWLVQQGIADPARIAIVGWSYGGYAALQASITEPALYKAIVAIAPVTDLALLKREGLQYGNSTITDKYVGDGPHIVAGSPAQNAARIAAPVLMFQGDKDLDVDIEQGKVMDAALARAGKRHEFIVYPGLDHQLDDSAARTDMLKRSAEFIAAAFGGAAAAK